MAPPAKKAKTIPNRTSGIHCGLRGNEYQIFMTMYMLVRAHNKYPAHQDYELRIERPEPEVGKFDDIWLKVGNEEVFVQVKYDSVSPTLTEGMLQSKGKDDRFSLYKYSKSFKECRKLAAPQRGKQIWWNVLMTNLPLSGKVSDIFESFDVDCMLTKVLGTGDLVKLKTGKMQKELGASKEFYEDFLLSVGSETRKTNKSCFKKLQRIIQDEIERVMFEDAEHTIHRLRVKVVKWVCNKICRDEKHFNRKWVDDFFKDIQSDYKSIIEAYRLELKDRLELYEHVTIGDRRVDRLKQCMQNEKIILLSIVESSILRLKQIYQILKDEKFTYLLFSRLQNISTREKVLNALKQNDSSKMFWLFCMIGKMLKTCLNLHRKFTTCAPR
ncbi:uncharacterized protein LOC119769832 [Culex quinquefasciatus]|uniref:uncharacterized protein LOC119769832 n=1 Tax=Culex quinquefasciatus TaxID=7176 RepID=UPI0018E2CAAC|nr:uncharacterized protein LOC119769832 [Culex quinquefasciatus]